MKRTKERRRGSRKELHITGRGLRTNGAEFTCKTADVSGHGASMSADFLPAIGETLVIYFQALGRVEGVVVGATANGFAMKFTHTDRKSDQVKDKLQKMLIAASASIAT